jgi:hypothetical protein
MQTLTVISRHPVVTDGSDAFTPIRPLPIIINERRIGRQCMMRYRPLSAYGRAFIPLDKLRCF